MRKRVAQPALCHPLPHAAVMPQCVGVGWAVSPIVDWVLAGW